MTEIQEPTVTHVGKPAVGLIHAGDGTWIHPGDIAATYVIDWAPASPEVITPEGVWTDLPEARPRCRVRVHQGDPAVTIPITRDGAMHHDPAAALEIDAYEGRQYADVRAEGEARWTTA